MFKRVFAFLALAFALSGTQSWAQTGCGGEFQPPCTGETIYISTFDGHQILKVVDAVFPTTTVVNTDSTKSPEDIVVGPDDKIYICDADNNDIRRMNQDGTTVETVYNRSTTLATQCNGGACPTGPEGPSFNTLGDLYFNTRGPGTGSHTGVWKIPASQLSPIPSGRATPVNVFTAAQTGSSFGEGTVFDTKDNLLIVDRSGNKVLESSPPYTPPPSVLISNPTDVTRLSTPIGIAVNSQNDIFVANNGAGTINHFSSTGAFLNTYVTFTSPDTPVYMEFDASDNLFVVTVQDATAGHGKLWRVPPSGSATLMVDLHTLFLGEAVTGLSSDKALGLGLPATTFTTAQQAIAPGTTTTFTYGKILDQRVDLSSDVDMAGAAFMADSFMQVAPGHFNSTNFPGTPQTPNWSDGKTPVPAGTTITAIAGTSGRGIVAENQCFDMNHIRIPCNIAARTTFIRLTSHYKTQSPQPCPALIIASDGENNWADITTGFDPRDPIIIGGTKGINSDEAIVNIAPNPNEDDVEGEGDEQGDDGHKGRFRFCKHSGDMDFDEPDSGEGMRGHMDAVTISGNQAIITGMGTLRNGTPVQYTAVVLGNAPVIGANLFAISWITATGSTFHTSGALIDGSIVVHTQ
jgi:streptogramin lyase